MDKAIKFDIAVEGTTYPCVLSMGASLDYFEATGLEVQDTRSASDLLKLIYFCAAAAAELHGKELPFDERTLRHHLTPAEGTAAIEAYASAIVAAGAKEKSDQSDQSDPSDSKKKTPQ